jgi:hypothetical protein
MNDRIRLNSLHFSQGKFIDGSFFVVIMGGKFSPSPIFKTAAIENHKKAASACQVIKPPRSIYIAYHILPGDSP